MKKEKVAYLVLNAIEIKSPIFPVEKPKGMIQLCAIFKTRKQALKYGDNIVEVIIKDK